MKKKVISILCVLVLLVGVLGLGSMVSAANDIGNLQVGYAVISIDPIDVEGTYRTIDYTSIYNGSGNAGLKEDLQALIDAGDPSVSVTTDAAGKVTKLTYTVTPLADKIASGDTAEFTYAANITALESADPQEGYFSIPLSGYGSTYERLSVGKMDDNGDGVIDDKDGSFITCIAVTDQNGNNMLFFSMDLITADDYSSNTVREGIRDALVAADASYVVPASSMMFSASHTHSSPDTGINDSYALPINAAQRAYEALLIAKTKEVAIAAMADRSEVTVSTGEIQADNMNATRHYDASERKLVTEKGWFSSSSTTKSDESISWVYGDNFGHYLPDDELVNSSSSSDSTGLGTTTTTTLYYNASNVSQSNETLQLVQFTPTDGDDPIVMVNFRAHPKLNSTGTTRYGIDNRHSSSGDYAVMLREKLNAFGYRASFIQGAAGNQNTWNYLDDTTLTPGVSNTTNGTAMYNEIMAYREPDGTSVTAYNDTLAFFKYTSLNGTTINAQSGFSYGARLADYALTALESMTPQDNGVIKSEQAFYTGSAQTYSDGLRAAVAAYDAELASYKAGTITTKPTFPYQYQHTDGKYYNLNSSYHANAVRSRSSDANSVDCKLELNCITIGSLAFVSAPNELYDRYNYDGDQVNNNLWDVFNSAANEAGYITPIVLGYTNGGEGYIPNVAAYEYNQANNDAGSLTKLSNTSSTRVIGVGAYEANTSKFAPGSGEQIIEQFQTMLLGMETSQPAVCPMCGEEVTRWDPWGDPSETQFYGGHYYLSDDLVQYLSTPAYQRTINADTCIDLNGHIVANSSTQTGRAFNVKGNITLRLMNGTVKGRGLSGGTTGGVINVGNGGSLYMTDVDVIREVYDGQTASNGGAIYAGTNCTVSMENCSVTGGVATGDGGNLYVNTGSTVTLASVTMEGGTATGNGDNIAALNQNTTISGNSVLKGESYFDSNGDALAVTFKDNVQAYESPDGVNIKLTTDTRLTFADLADTAKISVQGNACITDPTGIALVGNQLIADEGYYLDTSFTDRGVFAGDKWMCECGGLAADKHTCEYHAYSPWSSTSSLPTVGNIYLKNDVTTTAQASPNTTYKTLRIDLAGHSITHKVTAGAANTRVFGMNTGTTLVLTDTVGTGALKRDLSNLTDAQAAAISNYGIGVCVNTNGTFRMYGGTIDMQGQSTTGGGAIAGTTANSTIEIYGGTIKGASASYGGGIYSKGTVNLYGGQITEGKSNSGGGVFMSESAAKLTLTGDASVTGNYKADGTTASNINAAPSYLTISGTYTGTVGITVSSPAKGTVVAASDAADITHAILSVDGNGAYTFEVSGDSVVLNLSEDAVAADSNGIYYATIEEALAGCADSSVVLSLLQDVTSDITLTKDTAVELNGHSITGAITYENSAKLIISDANTTDYTVEDGNGFGTVPYSTNVTAADGYLLYDDGDVASAHAYEVKLSGIALRPKAQGIYYTSSFKGDEYIRSMVAEFGISLRVNTAPDAAYIQADPNGKTHTSQPQTSWVVGEHDTAFYGTLLENIMMAGNGSSVNGKNAQIPVYGMPYMKLSDGTYLFGNNYSCSLKELVELVDSQTLYNAQKEALVAMYSQYKTVMADWDITQIEAAYRESLGTMVTFADLYSNLKILGRTPIDGTGISTAWPGTGFSMNVNSDGSPLTLGVDTGTTSVYYCIEVDGEQVARVEMLGVMEYTLALTEGEHTVTVYRDSANTPQLSCKLEYICFNGEILDKPADKELYIEVIGDSIASGLGSLGTYTVGADWVNEEHSVSNSFGWFTAKDFDADISVIAKGGIGAVTTVNGKNMPQIYPYVNGYTGETAYDFARKPDLVIVELGANDGSKTIEAYTAGLTEVYQQIFDNYGADTKVLWVGKNENFYNVAASMNETFGANCYALYYQYGVSGSGPSTAGAAHPNAAEHRAWADAITSYITDNGILN